MSTFLADCKADLAECLELLARHNLTTTSFSWNCKNERVARILDKAKSLELRVQDLESGATIG